MKSATALYDTRLQQLVLENVSDIIVITDLDFCVQSWNHIAEHFYGITKKEAMGKYIRDLITLTYHDATIEEAFEQLHENKVWRGEVSFTGTGGETFFFLQTVKVVVNEAGEELGIMAVGRNITERKKAESQLAQSEAFYRSLIADALDVILLTNAEGMITFSAPSIYALLGYKAEEVVGTNAFGYIHPEDLGWAIQSFEKEIEESPEIKFIIIRLRKKNGDWIWCMARGNNLLNVPLINSVAVYIHDDTPRKQAADALKESERRFRNLVRDLQVGVLLKAADGQILMTNGALTRMFGLTEEQILGGKIWDLCDDVIHEDGSPFLLSQRPTFKAIQTRQPIKDVVMGVWNKQKKERTWIIINVDPVLAPDGELINIVCAFTDITERKKLEKKSIAEKIEHQRQIAQATIDAQEKERLQIGYELHDNLGQQLTSIKLFLDLAKTSANAEIKQLVETALKGVSAVIDDVRAMSWSLVPATLNDLGLVDSINALVDSLRTVQPIVFELNYIDFDEGALPENKKLALFRIIQEQFNNILKHAVAKTVTVNLACLDTEVLLEINDDGIGFDLDKIRKGLGLTNIINRSELFGGRAKINTSPGNGCTVSVWLPHIAVKPVLE